MTSAVNSRRPDRSPIVAAAAIVLVGAVVLAFYAASVLRDGDASRGMVSAGLWRRIVVALGGQTGGRPDAEFADVPITALFAASSTLALTSWLAGALWIAGRRRISWSAALALWGRYGWLWWIAPICWELVGTVIDLTGAVSFSSLWRAALPFWSSTLGAGWLTTLVVLAHRPDVPAMPTARDARIPAGVWFASAVYFACFAALNVMLYASLNLPHGDSAMYEEHVWNLLHGKGFRSYLDNGRPFLGEHIQVIHLAVIPLYLLWPSHLLLEICQSAWLAAGAIPAYRLARRHSGSVPGAALIAVAYLLYFPMQMLDIAVTYKTFRPNSFEIPFLLFALDALERSRYRTLLIWLSLALLCQEDAAAVIAPLGIWIACRQARFAGVSDRAERRRLVWLGLSLALFGAAYVALVVKVVLPWFRGGADVHFARYFDEFGGDSNAIAGRLLSHPLLLLAKVCGAPSWLFALGLVAPLGFLPLLSPGRLAVAAPLFAVLCLSDITNSPLHHFHAPLVPILVWAAAAGAPRAAGLVRRWTAWRNHDEGEAADDSRRRIAPERFIASGKSLPSSQPAPIRSGELPRAAGIDSREARITNAASVWCVLCALFSGAFLSLSPLGIGFWDPGSSRYWRNHFVPGERARRFPAVLAGIPQTARVASTDYIHPLFTHYARSYDYSFYRPDVPADTDYIVIDTQHPYSTIKRPEEVKEYRDHPEEWELVDDTTGGGGYFIVLKRKKADPAAGGRRRGEVSQ